jgi:hypothetical protein
MYPYAGESEKNLDHLQSQTHLLFAGLLNDPFSTAYVVERKMVGLM